MTETTGPQLTRLSDVSQGFLSELKLWLEQVGLAIPVNQLTGFSQFTAQQAKVDADESTSSAAFTDLATVGPMLSNLPAGKYLFIFGALCGTNAAASTDAFGLSFNGVAVQSGDLVDVPTSTDLEWGVYSTLHTFTDANAVNNTAKMQYATSAGPSDFRERWLIGLKYA